MQENLVSIIVPVYNVEAYLEECVDSLVKQTYSNIEIILVDDGSTDNSGIICDRFAEKNEIIQTIHQINKGLPAARNTGLNKSKGDWILYVDSDDWLYENSVEILMNNIDNLVDIVLFDVDRKENYILKKTDEVQGVYLSPKQIYNLFLDAYDPMIEVSDKNIKYIIPAWCKLYKKSFIDANGLYFDEGVKVHEDIPYAVKMYSKAESIKFVATKIYTYRDTPNSITNKYREKYAMEIEALMKGLQKVDLEKFDKEIVEKLFNDRLIAMTLQLLQKNICHKNNCIPFFERRKMFKDWYRNKNINEKIKFCNIKKYATKKRMAALLLKTQNFFFLNAMMKMFN